MFKKIKEIKEMTSMMSDIKKAMNDPSYLENMGLDIEGLEKELSKTLIKKAVLSFEKCHPDAVTPTYNYESDSGFDLHSTEDLEIGPFGRILVPTGLRFNIPMGHEIQVRPKSGLAIKQGLTVLNTPGTVDSGYDGEVKVIVFNTNNYSVVIPKGMKVGQAVLCPVINGKFVQLQMVDKIEDSERGSNGFGSTGI
jgi:dUTP pyrophosphatase